VRLNRRWLGIACLQGRIPLAVASLLVLAAMFLKFGPGAGYVLPAESQDRIQEHVPSFYHRNPGLDATQVRAALGHLPLIFEANRGQSNPAVKFLARGSGYELFLTANEAVLALQPPSGKTPKSLRQLSVLSMGLAQANPHAEVSGADLLPGKSNYFIGNDLSQWHRGIPQYSRVRYRNVYPGIDLVYYGNRGRLESDFEVAPGSNPRQVALRFRGADQVRIDGSGNLVLSLQGGAVVLESPRVYQRFGIEERTVSGRFELRSKDEAGFVLGDYDRSRTLIIDPVLTYSTYLGGSGNEACSVILNTGPVAGCPAIAVDTAFNAYVAGSTTSTDFPTSGSPFQSTLKGKANVFVAKFNSTATILEFATYLGGSDLDTTIGVAVDPGFNVVVAGNTLSANFPTKNGFQSAPLNAQNHAFVSRLDPNGQNLLYSTYLSGSGVDTAAGLALDPSGNAYLIGTTTSTETQTGFPSTLGAIQVSSRATNQFFVTKVDPTLSGTGSVAYSTYFGGSTPSNGETVGGGITVNTNSDVYITGGTNFTNMPVLNASQGTLAGGLDAFVTEMNPAAITGSQLLYSTYLGGTGDDIGYGIAVDSGSAYVVGSTSSTDFPAAGTGSFQSSNGGGIDAFMAKLANPVTTGTTPGSVTLSYSTYLGGSGTDVALGAAVDTDQGARIVGWTNSPNFPVINNPVQSGFGGGAGDAFVARIDTTATTNTAPGHYSTFLGGAGNDYGTGIAVDTLGAAYVAGETSSANFLTQAPPETNSFQPSLNGNTDAFVSKLGPVVSLGLSVIPSPTVVGVGNQVSYVYTVTNNGDFTNGVTFTDTITAGTTFVSATASPGSCGGAAGGIVGCTIGAMDAGATGTVTVILTPVPSLTPSTTPLQLPNSASVTVLGCTLPTCSASAETSVQVNDFTLTVAPASATVPAGVPATFTATVTPTGDIPSSVSFSCAGLPNGGTCVETTNPIPNLSNGAASTVLVINTVARVTTVTELWRKGRPFYALWLPIPGLALLGVGINGVSRKRRVWMAVLLSGFFALVFFQAACSSTKTTTSVTGTPAGTYVVTVSATSGATRTATVTLVVQ